MMRIFETDLLTIFHLIDCEYECRLIQFPQHCFSLDFQAVFPQTI